MAREQKTTDTLKRGRPSVLKNGKLVAVYMDENARTFAEQLGQGNVSEGIRRAVRECQAKKK